MINRAYLSLGSNINPIENTRQAFALLARKTTLVAVSSIWETAPVGYTEQPNFLNGATIIETDLSARRLKATVLAAIEATLGRVRTSNKNAPRTMDIDIILFNEDVFTLDGRQIPSPELLERSFVAIPMAEIAPSYRHPITKQSLAQIAAEFEEDRRTMIRRPEFEARMS